MLSAQVAYRFMAEGDHTSVTGCVLLFAVFFSWEYHGKYKHMYTAWEENGDAGTPILNLPLAKFIWCKLHLRPVSDASIDRPTAQYDIDVNSPRHCVGMADDLSKFPPCYLVTAEKDPFRDDGTVFNHRLGESGVRRKLDYYEALPHYFHAFPGLGLAHEMMDKAVEGARFVLE